MATLPESHHCKTIPIKNLKTGFLLTAAVDSSVSAHPEGFVGVANTWKLDRGEHDKWAIRSSGIGSIPGLPIEGYYLAANGPPGTSSLKVQEEPFHWHIVLDESRTDFLIKSLVPSTPDGIVVTQVSETGVDIQPYDRKANSPYQRWIFNLA
ncbi:hypothetical protein F5887DRAFT_1284759 [Amanita rubescens]|nr:hypothetical protein F5887DRAFT_1166583 [Amanita rubescens]KAF8327695.1 hypothetical protein F5887DRAFT_1288470 [Amanita rubescens]KAF8338504.1 hypothetical protein F5887DRAFT_1284759 [Amanita rubescens]